MSSASSSSSSSAPITSPRSDNTTRFSNRVADYISSRPNYAPAAVELLLSMLPFSSSATSISNSTSKDTKTPSPATILDIGSGTGILTSQLLSRAQATSTSTSLHIDSVRVIGLEPNAGMRTAAESQLYEYAKSGQFSSMSGTAENTGLEDESIDLVVAAQAFHWFEVEKARKECLLILKKTKKRGGDEEGRGRMVALLWNDRRGVRGANPVDVWSGSEEDFERLDSPVTSAWDLLMHRHARSQSPAQHGNTTSKTTTTTAPSQPGHKTTLSSLSNFFGPKGFTVSSFENAYSLDFEQLKRRLMSSSYTPMEGEEGYEEMMGELKGLWEEWQKDGKIDFVYDTRVVYGAIS